jgi:rhodanese-related sulfurtransferase
MAIDFEKLKAELRSSVAQSVVRTITAPVLYNKLLDSNEDAELVVVDVRDGKAFAQSHVRGAVSFAPPVSSGSSGGDAKGASESKSQSQSAGRGGAVSFPAQRADPLDGKAVAVMDARSADRFALRLLSRRLLAFSRLHSPPTAAQLRFVRCSDADAYTAGVMSWLQDNVTNCSALYFVKASLSATFPPAHTASQACRAYQRCVIAGRI